MASIGQPCLRCLVKDYLSDAGRRHMLAFSHVGPTQRMEFRAIPIFFSFVSSLFLASTAPTSQRQGKGSLAASLGRLEPPIGPILAPIGICIGVFAVAVISFLAGICCGFLTAAAQPTSSPSVRCKRHRRLALTSIANGQKLTLERKAGVSSARLCRRGQWRRLFTENFVVLAHVEEVARGEWRPLGLAHIGVCNGFLPFRRQRQLRLRRRRLLSVSLLVSTNDGSDCDCDCDGDSDSDPPALALKINRQTQEWRR